MGSEHDKETNLALDTHDVASRPAGATSGLNEAAEGDHRPKMRIPRWIKVALSVFVLVFMPGIWWQYGSIDFLWLCHVSLLLTLAAAWLESALLASMATVGVLVIQILWLGGLIRGMAGLGVSESMQYMFDPNIPLFMRGLSLYHGWMPFLLIFMLRRLGYARRALASYLPLAGSVFLLCYFFTLPPPAPADNPSLPVNINFIHGLTSTAPQSWMSSGCWLLLVMLGSSLGLFLPAHWLMCRIFGPPPERPA